MNDEFWMSRALSLAETAKSLGEVPVGALIVKDNCIIGTGFNTRELACDPLGHAEMNAITGATQSLKTWRLIGCSLYVTLEPCLMCAGALYQSRISKVIFGAYDSKAGALKSLYSIHDDARLNHRFEATGGILENECSSMISDFFRKKRKKG
ncbi:MAG: tRNA adenosine(34) deaminase TadA [Pseudomonadota bacterium]